MLVLGITQLLIAAVIAHHNPNMTDVNVVKCSSINITAKYVPEFSDRYSLKNWLPSFLYSGEYVSHHDTFGKLFALKKMKASS